MKLFLPLLLLIIASCTTAKQVAKWNATHKDKELQNCIENYPPKIVVDSSAYKASLNVIEDLNKQIVETAETYESQKDELLQTIERLAAIAPENCDSLAEAIYRLSAKERRRGDSLLSINKKLKEAAVKVQPVKVTEWDTKLVKQLEEQLKNCYDAGLEQSRKIDELQADRDYWKGKAKKRWWFMWIILVACGVWTFRKPLLKMFI